MAQLIFVRIAKLSEPVMSLDSRDAQKHDAGAVYFLPKILALTNTFATIV